MFSNIKIDELIPLIEKNKMSLIDLRSPSEFEEFRIPGSFNIPLFTDKERAEVGTLYTQQSKEAAMDRGLEILSAKLPAFIGEFKKIEGDKTLFCWRGGMRSKTAATLLDLMNIHVNRLEGGIRSYRKWVVNQLEQYQPPFKALVLNGLTGTGKTRILHALSMEGYPVIDLEGMANHKGSNFGHIGQKPHIQKMFDSLLIHRLMELKNSPYVLLEAESSRIGKVVIPPFLNELKDQSLQIIIEMPMEERVKEILKDYEPAKYQQECIDAFMRIKEKIHTPIAKQIEEALVNGDFASAIRLLLEYYYDSRYKHTGMQYPDSQKITLNVNNLEEAIEAVKKVIAEKYVTEKIK